jgi:hypothetical protein
MSMPTESCSQTFGFLGNLKINLEQGKIQIAICKMEMARKCFLQSGQSGDCFCPAFNFLGGTNSCYISTAKSCPNAFTFTAPTPEGMDGLSLTKNEGGFSTCRPEKIMPRLHVD